MLLSYLYYLFGYEEEEEEVDPKPEHVKQRGLVHKQVRHTFKKPVKLKSFEKEIPSDMTSSQFIAPAIPVGKVTKELPWSSVISKTKKRGNPYDVLRK